MVLSLIFGKKYAQSKIQKTINGENGVQSTIDLIVFDTMVAEEHKFSSRVTYFPIEDGRIVSDHIINQPDVVILSGLITDTPLNIFAPFDRSVAAFNTLIQLHERREVLDIVTGIKVYKNMAITSIDVPRTIKTGQTLTFNIELQKIVFDNTIERLNDPSNVFAGIQNFTPREIVAENANYPLIGNDPAFSLKDQATTSTNVGVQSLATVPPAVLPNVLVNLSAIGAV